MGKRRNSRSSKQNTAKEINKQKTRQTRRLRNRFSSLRKLARRARQAWSRTSWLLSSRPSHSRMSAHNGWWLVMRQRVAKYIDNYRYHDKCRRRRQMALLQQDRFLTAGNRPESLA